MNVFDLSATLTLNTGNYERGLSRAEGMAKKVAGGGFTVLKGAMANLVSGGINMVAGALTNNLGKAISRVDTLNNYSIVMGNLGHDSKDAQKAIDTLADGIDGLPTSLDAIASIQQQFGALGGKLSDATDLTLALNNATLAGGRGQEIANSAMQQWYQMIASGKPDLMSMRIINEAMPAQLNAIAKEVLGSKANWQDLNSEWQKSPEMTEKVKDAILKLNEDGGKGMESFQQQAKDATKGIDTSMQNLQTSISKGMANVMQNTGLDTWISDQLGAMKEAVNNAFTWFTDFANNIKDVGLVNAIGEELGKLAETVPALLNSVDWGGLAKTAISQLTNGLLVIGSNLANVVQSIDFAGLFQSVSDGIAQSAPQFLEVLGTMLEDLGTWLAENGATAIAGLGEAFINALPTLISFAGHIVNAILKVMLGLPVKLISLGLSAIGKLALGLLKGINRATKAMGRIVKGILGAVGSLGGSLLKTAWSAVKSFASGIGKGIGTAVKKAKEFVGKVKDKFVNGFTKIGDVGSNIVKGIWNGISNGYDWIKGKIKSWIGNVTKFIKNVLGIKSPSTVMAKEVGKWIPLGIAKGIEDNASAVDDALEDAMDIPDMADGLVDTGSLSGGIKMVSLAPNITVDGAENPEEYAQRFMREMKMEARMA